MENNEAIRDAARKELLRRAAKKELDRRRANQVSQSPGLSWTDWGKDIAQGAATGLTKGVTGLAGSIGDAQQMTGDVAAWGAGKLGFSPSIQDAARFAGRRIAVPGMPDAPTSETLMKGVETVTGEMPDAQSFTGQVVQRAGEFAPAAALGPGTFGRRAAMAAAPALASELAGRVPGVEGSAAQPYVETAAALAAGLPVAGGGKTNALKTMRENAPSFEEVAAQKKASYKTVDNAGIAYDGNAYKGAAMRIKSNLSKAGWDKMTGNHEIAALVNSIDDLLKPRKVASWTRVDSILKNAKKIMRSGADDTTKTHAGIIVDKLEALVSSGNFKSKSGISKEQVNQTVSTARELARREILAKEINEMKRRLPGYLVGDEGAYRNQFGAYIRSPEGASLKPLERDAFAKVVRREGPLNVAHTMGSRWGQIAGGSTGSVIGGLAGSAFGPIGSVIGAGAGGLANMGIQTGFRKFMDKISEKAVEDALKTVLAGREAQGIATSQAQKEKLRATIRAALTAEAASRPAMEDMLVNGPTDGIPR